MDGDVFLVIDDKRLKVDEFKEIQKKENLKMDFFATISHELRTPINLILSSLQLIDLKIDFMKELKWENREFLEKNLKRLRQNSYRILKLVNNLIDSNRIDSGKFNYTPRNYDIISLVEDICMSTSDFIKNMGMNIVFDTDKEEKIIAVDIDSIERIILNLISNAIKFSKENGLIEVYIKCNDTVDIIIKDNGIGIEPNNLEKVFDRFEQVKNNDKKNGSGIGLSLVRSLVEMNNGIIKVKSKIGIGTEFIISLEDKILENDCLQVELKHDSRIDNMKLEFSDIYC